jgi:hypothetical protein
MLADCFEPRWTPPLGAFKQGKSRRVVSQEPRPESAKSGHHAIGYSHPLGFMSGSRRIFHAKKSETKVADLGR